MWRHASVVVLTLVLTATVASAEIRWWSPQPSTPDADDLGIWPGQDICTGTWQDTSDQYHYFRLDLERSPSYPPPYPNYAHSYGFYIDGQPGGAEGAGDSLVPDQMTGVDYILDTHWYDGQFVSMHSHSWDPVTQTWGTVDYLDPSNPLGARGIGWDQDLREAQGCSLEWRIPISDLGDLHFLYRSATMNTNEAGNNVTWDILPMASSPEPGTLVLFGLGLAGASYRRRRRGG